MPTEYDYLDSERGWIKEKGQLWRWKAQFDDGFVLHQFNDETSRFHRIEEIDQDHLVRFTMYSKHHPQIYGFNFPRGAKLIHKYKKGVIHVPISKDEIYKHRYQFYIFGFDCTILCLSMRGNLYIGEETRVWAWEEAKAEALEISRRRG